MRATAAPLFLLSTMLLAGCAVFDDYIEERVRNGNLLRPTSLATLRVDGQAPQSTGDQVTQKPKPQTPAAEDFGPIDLDKFCFRKKSKATTGVNVDDSVACISAFTLAETDPRVRDDLQDLLIQRSDRACDIFSDLMFARVSARQAGLDIVSLFSGLAGAIIDGPVGKSVLSGLSGAASGTSAIFDARFLQNQLISTITKQIRTQREDLLTEIMAKRIAADGTRSTADQYTRGVALRDVERYHSACSFLAAIETLGVKAGQRQITRVDLKNQETVLLAQRDALRTKAAVLKDSASAFDENVLDSLTIDLQDINRQLAAIRGRQSALSGAPVVTNTTNNSRVTEPPAPQPPG